MTLVLHQSDWDELTQQTPEFSDNLSPNFFETSRELPKYLGRGYTRCMELLPGVWLDMIDHEFHQNWLLKMPAHDHSVQYLVLLSGLIHHVDIYPTLGGSCSYLSGCGISPAYTAGYERSQRLIGVSIHLLPDVLEQFFSGMPDCHVDQAKMFFKQDEWKVSFFPKMTLEIQRVVQQILKAPFCGMTRHIYLQAKVFELLALQLDQVLTQEQPYSLAGLKPDTIARIHHAREILATRLENPPSLLDLAQQVGVSDRTLRRGFRELFGTTVIGYLTQQRMKQAEQLLREQAMTVAEVANLVGYEHLGHFAAAFKRQFGMTPRDCLAGRNSALRV